MQDAARALRQQWEPVSGDGAYELAETDYCLLTERLPVPGGWLYRTVAATK